jgi:glutamine amidotransferase
VSAASSDVLIIDSGGANLASLQFALERLGATSVVSSDAAEVRAARKVLLPGVGAAGDAMARLRSAGLDQAIPLLEQPLLGICLGMQLLFTDSDEGDTACLGIIEGRVRRIAGSSELPVPHMGWNNFSALSDDPLLRGFGGEDYVYFVHGYAAAVGVHTLASTEYGAPFSAIVRRDNFWGVQFHPERSAAAGARLLKNFLEL